MPDSPANQPASPHPLQVGIRVMIRRRLGADEIAQAAGTLDAGKTLTDVVGHVIDLDEVGVTVRTRNGAPNTIAHEDIVAAKEIPPRPGRRGRPHRAIGIEALEEIMVEGWVPHEREWRGRWLLRAADGYTGRANSCLVLGEPDRPIGAALSAVEKWYRERWLAPLLQVPLAPGVAAGGLLDATAQPRPGSLDDPLVEAAEAHGWAWSQPTLVMTVPTDGVLAATATSVQTAGCATITATLDDAWWSLADSRQRQHEVAARRVLSGSPEQVFVTMSDEHGPCARGRIAFSDAWGGVFAVETRENARRHGYARTIVRACAQEASDRGVACLYLQVSAENTAAVALYESLGFTTHHTDVYLRPVTRPLP